MRTALTRLLTGLLATLLTINAFAATSRHIKNLANVDYPNKAEVSLAIKQLFDEAGKDAYSLSLPLIASAQQGDKAEYDIVLADMSLALSKMADDDFKSWMLGRLLLAADSIDDTVTANKTQSELTQLLTKLSEKPRHYTQPEDAYYAWGWAYLAHLNPETYAQAKKPLLVALVGLEGNYHVNPNHDNLSNTVWVLVMLAEAAANAGDQITYANLLENLKELTSQATVTAALQYSLNRTVDSSDYPAWSLAGMYWAAVNVNDQAMLAELKLPSLNAIQEAIAWGSQPGQPKANQWKAQAEASLAQVDMELAKVNMSIQ